MTKLMESAVKAMQSLPRGKQQSFARFVIHELEEDAKWEATTAKHADRVRKLVAEILDADQRGETELLHPDQL